MNQDKLEVVKQEMLRVNVDILGISELKWTGMGEFNSGDLSVSYCGQGSLRRNGVAIMVNNRVWNVVLGCNLKNDRMISVHFQGKLFSITVIQAYAPTSNAEELEVEPFYEDLQDLFELRSKKDVLFIIGDWNAKIGSQETPRVTGKFGLGVWNEAGQRLVEFCQENALLVANTLFQQHKRRIYTWTWWTWVWVDSGSWWWTGRPGVLQFTGSRVGHDWASKLNWTLPPPRLCGYFEHYKMF